MDEADSPSIIGQIDGRGAIVAVEEDVGGRGGAVLPAQSSQLTLSFQGEVFVFDNISPEKVQAVLLLLGGQELPPSDIACNPLRENANSTVSSEFPRCYSNPHRLASILRYREKRKNLNFNKKVVYSVRKEVACRMKRKKGQFVSSKTNSDEVLSPSSSCEQGHSNSQDENVSNFCQNCQVSKDSTPMMRRGPTGPKSLCNACGLMWANKKILRNHPQSSAFGNETSPMNPSEQNDANDSDIGSNNGHMLYATSNGHEMESIMTSANGHEFESDGMDRIMSDGVDDDTMG